jgi:hypothetical protein
VLEKPKVRKYPVDLSVPRNESLISVVCHSEFGTVDFAVLVNSSGEDSQILNGVAGTANETKSLIIAGAPIPLSSGSFVDLDVRSVSVDAAWFSVEINYISV